MPRLREKLEDHLKWAEGVRQFPYTDSVGKLTIGVGRNLDDVGLRPDEIDYLLKNDIKAAIEEAERLPYWDKLNEARKIVVADMIFNMGLPTYSTFKRMGLALSWGDWNRAAYEMIDSKWYGQTGRRARKLVKAMRTGEWPS